MKRDHSDREAEAHAQSSSRARRRKTEVEKLAFDGPGEYFSSPTRRLRNRGQMLTHETSDSDQEIESENIIRFKIPCDLSNKDKVVNLIKQFAKEVGNESESDAGTLFENNC